MITQELIDYIKAEQAKNTSVDTIKSELQKNGWKIEDIEEGFKSTPAPVVEPEKKGLVHSIFRTKGSSFLFFVLISFIFGYIPFLNPLFFLGGFGPFSPFIIFIAIALFLKAFGYKKEGDNAISAIGMVVLTIFVLAIIGLGICLLSFR